MREINMRRDSSEDSKGSGKKVKNHSANMCADEKINADPLGMWTGVPTDDITEKPVQDADDL